MRSGKLDRRIRIERKSITLSASGDPIEVWASLGERWASVGPVTGNERFSQPQIIAEQQTEFRVRWSSDIADLNPLDRIIYPAGSSATAAVYDIAAVHEIGRREGLRIIATRRTEGQIAFAVPQNWAAWGNAWGPSWARTWGWAA